VVAVVIKWSANPFRGDKFAEGWAPVAEAVMDYGAISWSFYRAKDGLLDFIQTAVFESKADFERYWYSETVAEKRAELSGTYQIPLLPAFYEVVGEGSRSISSPAPAEP
jgi:hypothetical protein